MLHSDRATPAAIVLLLGPPKCGQTQLGADARLTGSCKPVARWTTANRSGR